MAREKNIIRRVLESAVAGLWNSAGWPVHPGMRPLITVAVLVFLAQIAPVVAQSTPASFNPLVNMSNTADQVVFRADGACRDIPRRVSGSGEEI